MFQILVLNQKEIYPDNWDRFPRPDIRQFFSSQRISQITDNNLQRRILYKAFELLLQSEYLFRLGGWANMALYNHAYDPEKSWHSPRIQILSSAIAQMEIIASRIAFEKFMDLLHPIGEFKKIKAKRRSRLAQFRTWILDPSNPFVVFATWLPEIYAFNLFLRDKEVHTDSRFVDRVLRLAPPNDRWSNNFIHLSNMVSSFWYPMIAILNNQPLQSSLGVKAKWDWIEAYNMKQQDRIVEKCKLIEKTLDELEKFKFTEPPRDCTEEFLELRQRYRSSSSYEE